MIDLVRKVIIINIKSGAILGQMIDDGKEPPFGTTDLAEDMLRQDPPVQFARYHAGWSNGYIETKAA